ncbi:MAG: phosphotransferase [Arcobacter sp.]|nr:phosphotransferase [Arcobacter sp.]
MLFKNKYALLFSFIEGEIPKVVNKKQIEEISCFIASLHKLNLKPKVKNIYSKEYFLLLLSTLTDNKKEFEKRFNIIKDIDLSSNCFIHGDLFPDNSKFIDNKLNGVYDFGQSCYGNNKFDLSVLIVSWCFEDYKFNIEFFNLILKKYNLYTNNNIVIKNLKPYLLYSCLYYSIQRLTRKNNIKDYNEYLRKFDILKKLL